MSTPAPKNLHNTYHPPPPPYLTPIITCGIIMALSLPRSLILPGSPLFDYVLAGSPTAQTSALWIQNALFYFLYGAHAVETVLFMRKLQAHGVSAGSGAWWKWVGTCFVGGKFCFEYFDKLVGKKV